MGSIPFAALTLLVLILPGDIVSAQSTMVLRDLTLVADATITSMDIDGLTLDDGRHFSWDQILQGDVGTGQQSEFDRWLVEIGDPLFRVRQRLVSHDFATLQPFADRLAERALAAGVENKTLYLARCAQLRSLLSHGRREAAVIPLLQILKLRAANPGFARLDALGSLRLTEFGICEDLLPVWFDREQAEEVISMPGASAELRENAGPAARVYLTTLAIAANQLQPDKNHNPLADDDPWQAIYSAQSALLVENWQQVLDSLPDEADTSAADRHAIALYYRGLASRGLTQSVAANEDRSWMLTLLQIPANYQDRFSELSAAAIFAVVADPVNQADSQFDGLRKELATRYRNTVFGKRTR
jgi:hypothetical protein